MHKLTGLFLIIAIVIGGCLGIPAGVDPVSDFDLDRYLGTWYEIARLDHSFEKGLDNVTADYSIRSGGGVKVINRGYVAATQTWKEAEGKAFFVGSDSEGYLKVSFFGPFYGSYVIFELDKDYQYAFVTSSKKSYLWLLARTPTVDKKLIDRFIEKSETLGFDTHKLIFVKHDRSADR